MAQPAPKEKSYFAQKLDSLPGLAECAGTLKADHPAKHFIIPLLIAVVIYAVSYTWIEHNRTRKGPWVIAFTNSIAGAPAILINQSKVGVTNVQLVFLAEKTGLTNSPKTVVFDRPHEVPFDVPFGQCIFMDPTFLPGTLTFRIFGHEIELLPRVLMVDHEEHRWRGGEIIELPRAEQRK